MKILVTGTHGQLATSLAEAAAAMPGIDLVAAGRPSSTPVAVVSDGSMPTERAVWSTLGQVAEDLESQFIRPPAIVVVGEVVAVANPQRYAVPGARRS